MALSHFTNLDHSFRSKSKEPKKKTKEEILDEHFDYIIKKSKMNDLSGRVLVDYLVKLSDKLEINSHRILDGFIEKLK